MSDDLCSICLNNLDDEQTYTLEACGHQFHTKCIINWFRNSSTCPCCRNNTYEAANNIPGYILWHVEYVFQSWMMSWDQKLNP